MALESGWGHDGVAFNGKEMRELVETLTGGQTGVTGPSTAFKVSQQTVAASTVKVAEGGAVVPATGAGLGGQYQVYNDADLTSPVINPTAANGRKDRLIVRVTAGVAALEVVEGVASGTPAEPSITGDNYLELALITLPASTTNVTDAMITDRRVRLGTAPVVCTSTTRPATPYEGLEIYETDTDRKYVYSGSVWLPVSVGRRFNAGNFAGSSDAGGNITIAHGLGAVPVGVATTLDSTNSGSVQQVAKLIRGGVDATNFVVAVVRSDTGALLGSTAVHFDWIATT